MVFPYISIAGTQISAIFNPYSILKQKLAFDGIPLINVVLMGTEKTVVYAERLKKIFEMQDSSVNVKIEKISSNDRHNGTHPAAHEVLRSYLDQPFIFNLSGGMNFQIALCVLEAIRSNATGFYVYPETHRCYITKLENGVFIEAFEPNTFIQPASLDISLILDSHDIAFQCMGDAANAADDILNGIKRSSIAIPPDALKNVQIENVVFDYIWNNRNTLVFVCSHIGVPKENAVQTAREIGNAAQERKIIKNLFHRRFFVMTDNKLQAERMRTYRKIDDVVFVPHNKGKPVGHQLDSVAERIEKMFVSTPFSTLPLSPEPKDPNEYLESYILTEGKLNSVLAVALGTEILPTLIAIYSLRGQVDDLIIGYTPGNEKIEIYKKAMVRYGSLFKGVKRLSFYPISLAGDEFLALPVNPKRELITVISPGTKSQGSYLTFTAVLRRGIVYSIDAVRQELRCLSGNGDHLPLSGPSPMDLLELRGENLDHEHNENQTTLHQDKELFESTISLIRQIVAAEGCSLKPFFSEVRFEDEYPIKTYSQVRRDGKMYASITSEPGRKHIWQLTGGEWFERLIGYVMMQSGACDVQVRIRGKWSTSTQRSLEKWLKTSDVYMKDIDVLIRQRGRYYAISCKATAKATPKSDPTIEHVCNQAKAFAHALGRYCIPLVCFLKFGDDPDRPPVVENDVPVFGYNTFTDHEKVGQLFNWAAERRSTRL